MSPIRLLSLVGAALLFACTRPYGADNPPDAGAMDVDATTADATVACSGTCAGHPTCRSWDFAHGCPDWMFRGDPPGSGAMGTCAGSNLRILATNTFDVTAAASFTSPIPTRYVHASLNASIAEWRGPGSTDRPLMVLSTGADAGAGTDIAMLRANSAAGKIVYELCPGTVASAPCASPTFAVEKNTPHRLTLDLAEDGTVTFSVDCTAVANYGATIRPQGGATYRLVLGAADGAPLDGSFDDVVLRFNRP